MAEQTAGPSTIPSITISTHNQESLEDDSSSSSSASPTMTALETPTSLEPPHSELSEMPELAQTSELPPVTVDVQQLQTPITSPKPKTHGGGSGSSATPPRTQSGAPTSVKRTKAQSRGMKSAENIQSDELTPWHGVVVDYAPQKEQAVIFPAKMVHTSSNIPYNDEGWAFQRATGYSDYIGSGFFFLNVNGEKKRKNVKDNTYVFFVIEGAVEVLIHETSYAVAAGGVFVVPRGNFYSIRNISEKKAKVFFTQTRQQDRTTMVDTGMRPSSKSFILADWLLQRVVVHFLRLRVQAFDWYWQHLAKYRHYFTTRRLYFLFFILGLMVRRLPFIGSPPILNIQLIRLR